MQSIGSAELRAKLSPRLVTLMRNNEIVPFMHNLHFICAKDQGEQ